MNNPKIVIIEDEVEIREMIQIVLEKEGFREVKATDNGIDGLLLCQQFEPDLILLDVMMPGLDGFTVCKKLREFTQAPIFFLTARTSDLDKLHGFSIGADDYITKPFHPLEVVARVKAQLRRLQILESSVTEKISQDQEILQWPPDLQIKPMEGQVVVRNEEIMLPAMEFRLLIYLAQHPNRIFSKRQLYENVWGEESLGDDHTVMVHIRRLREKIEEKPSHPNILVTVRGLGYKFVPPKEASR